MKVLGFIPDEGGSALYRMHAPADEVKLLGVDIRMDDAIDIEGVRDSTGRITKVLEIREDVDLLIIQRPLGSLMVAVIEQAQRQGIATVVEFDDDFSTVHTANVAHEGLFVQEHVGPQWAEKAAAIADHVTVSTPQLLKYARHGRASVLRNCVPDSIFDTLRPKSEITNRIGWTGSVQTHPNDLQQTKGAVAEVLKSNDLAFYVVGDGEGVRSFLGLHKSTDLYKTGWMELSSYYEAISTVLDIGIVPLEISPFNQAKSALKGLEYAALGIPFVASPTREYERLEAYGIGKTAKTPGEWRKHLQRMIDRPAEMERIANEARDRIKAEHVYSVNAPQWIEAWEKAIDYRKTL